MKPLSRREEFFNSRYVDTVNTGLIGKVNHLLHLLLEYRSYTDHLPPPTIGLSES